MTSQEPRPAPAYPSRYFGGEAVDCVVLDMTSHFVAAWTALLEGRREVVAVQVRPCWVALDSPSLERDWVTPATRELADAPQGTLAPLSSAMLRSIPWGELLKARHGHAYAPSEGWIFFPEVAEFLEISESELDYLMDAWTYVEAVENGHRAPAQVIARERNLSPRTAQGRISKAEALGFLTPAARGRITRQLTPRAQGLIDAIVRRHPTSESGMKIDG